MSCKRGIVLLMILVVFVAIMNHCAEAARTMPMPEEDFAGANHLAEYSSVYKRAKYTMSCWLQMLDSGPSPRGPGH